MAPNLLTLSMNRTNLKTKPDWMNFQPSEILFEPQRDADRLRLKTLTCLAEMEEVSRTWIELEQRSTAPMTWFQGYHWCHNWMKTHGGTQYQPHIFAVFQGDTLRAIWPLMIERHRIGIYVMRHLGEPHSQYANILTETGELEPQYIALFQEALTKTPSADTIVLNLVPENSPLHDILPQTAKTRELVNEAAHLDLRSFRSGAEYFAQASKSQKRARRHGQNVLEREGQVSFRVLRPGMPQYLELIAKCVDQKQSWINRTGRISLSLGFENHAGFLSSIPTTNFGKDGPYLFALYAGNKLVATEVGFLQKGHYYCYLGSFAWDIRHASPGRQQMERTIAWLIDNNVQTFDLLANPSGYKERFSSRSITMDGYVVSHTRVGRIYGLLWTRTVRPSLKKLYQLLPAQVRISVSIVRKLELSNCV